MEGIFSTMLLMNKNLNAIIAESIGYEAHNVTDKTVTMDDMMALNKLAPSTMSKMDAIETLEAFH